MSQKAPRASKPTKKPRRATGCGSESPPEKPLTAPDPVRLAQIREHVGRINSRAHIAMAALDRDDEGVGVLGVRDLWNESKNGAANTVTVLLLASADPRPAVRTAAAEAMSCHPYGPIRNRLAEMLDDRHPDVRAAVSKALDDMHDLRPPCIQCGSDGYDPVKAVRLPEPSDPHAIFVRWPVFCSPSCAVEYACDVVRAEIEGGRFHECLVTGEWRPDSESTCDDCVEAEAIGRPAEEGAS